MKRATTGDQVTVVIAIQGDDERTAIFSTPETARAWIDALPEDWNCVCIDPMVVDVPEFGNVVQYE